MPTFKVDDCFAHHPKTIALLERPRGAEAIGLWVLAGSYCARYKLDGFISTAQLRRLGLDLELATLLVEAGFWVEGDHRDVSPGESPGDNPGESPPRVPGYTFRDWLKWNESKADVEARRERDREKKRKQRTKSQDFSESKEPVPGAVPRGVPPGHPDRIGKVKVKELTRSEESNLVDTSPDTIPAPPARTTWLQIGKLYRERYLKAKAGKVLDYHPHAHFQQWQDLSILVDGYPDPLDAAGRAMDRFFENAWAKGADYPPSALVKSFGKYYAPPEPVETDAEKNARIQRERDEEAFMRRYEREQKEAQKWLA